MVHSYVFFTILLVIVYSFTHDNSRYMATAAVIRQIWTGNCRMGCRPSSNSEDDGLSGLSGLVVPLSEQEEAAHNCVCESCPCELIENFVKACNPATRMYSSATGTVFGYTNSVFNKFHDAYDRVARVLECRTSCRRQAQLVNSRSTFDSSENFTIVEKPVPPKRAKEASASRSSKDASAPKPSVSGVAKHYGSELAQTFSDIANKFSGVIKSDKSTSPPIITADSKNSMSPSGSKASSTHKDHKKPRDEMKRSRQIQIDQTLSEETLKPATSVLENCSKCAELGKVCIGGCPGAEEKRKNKKK